MTRPILQSEMIARIQERKTRVCALAECGLTWQQATLSACGRCKGVWYCSREHQTSDWARHKRECKKSEKASSDKDASAEAT
jgi:hypothetical protein